MADGRVHGVQVLQPAQNLARHALHRLQIQVLVQVAVLPQVARREQLGDEVDAVLVRVLPALEAFDDAACMCVCEWMR